LGTSVKIYEEKSILFKNVKRLSGALSKDLDTLMTIFRRMFPQWRRFQT